MQKLKGLTKPLKAGFKARTTLSINVPNAFITAQFNRNTKKYTINVYVAGGYKLYSFSGLNFSAVKNKLNKLF